MVTTVTGLTLGRGLLGCGPRVPGLVGSNYIITRRLGRYCCLYPIHRQGMMKDVKSERLSMAVEDRDTEALCCADPPAASSQDPDKGLYYYAYA